MKRIEYAKDQATSIRDGQPEARSRTSGCWMRRTSRCSLLLALYTLHTILLASNCAEHPLSVCLEVSECHEPSISKTQTVTEGYENKEKEEKRQRQNLSSPSSPSIHKLSGCLLVPFRPLLRANAAVSTFSLPVSSPPPHVLESP